MVVISVIIVGFMPNKWTLALEFRIIMKGEVWMSKTFKTNK
jgi:hypothetical protein